MLKCQIIGHLGADAEKKTVDGKSFIAFRVANTTSYKDAAGNKHEETNWVDCTLNRGESLLPFLKKGCLVYCTGDLRTRIYDSAKDKCKKVGMTIRVDLIQLLSGVQKKEEGKDYEGF